MREVEIPVKFEPLGKTVHVLKDTKIVEAAACAGVSRIGADRLIDVTACTAIAYKLQFCYPAL